MERLEEGRQERRRAIYIAAGGGMAEPCDGRFCTQASKPRDDEGLSSSPCRVELVACPQHILECVALYVPRAAHHILHSAGPGRPKT